MCGTISRFSDYPAVWLACFHMIIYLIVSKATNLLLFRLFVVHVLCVCLCYKLNNLILALLFIKCKKKQITIETKKKEKKKKKKNSNERFVKCISRWNNLIDVIDLHCTQMFHFVYILFVFPLFFPFIIGSDEIYWLSISNLYSTGYLFWLETNQFWCIFVCNACVLCLCVSCLFQIN